MLRDIFCRARRSQRRTGGPKPTPIYTAGLCGARSTYAEADRPASKEWRSAAPSCRAATPARLVYPRGSGVFLIGAHLVDERPHHLLQIGILACQEQHVVRRHRGAAGVVTEALEVDGYVFCISSTVKERRG